MCNDHIAFAIVTNRNQRSHPSMENRTHIVPLGSVETILSHFHHRMEDNHRVCVENKKDNEIKNAPGHIMKYTYAGMDR